MKSIYFTLLCFFLSIGISQAQNPGELDLTFNAEEVNFGDGANSTILTT